MENQINRRPSKPHLVYVPHHGQQLGVFDAAEKLFVNLFREYQRAVFRSRLQWFLLGAMAFLLGWLLLQNLSATPRVTQQPVIQHHAPG